jgi:AbrB family looped-hinge helix DNA binding protein
MSRVTEKGQVTIPKEIRERLGIRPGDEVTFENTDEGYLIRKEIEVDRFEKWRGSPRPTRASRSGWPTCEDDDDGRRLTRRARKIDTCP